MLLRGQSVDARRVRANPLLDPLRVARRSARAQIVEQSARLVREDVDTQVTAVVATRRARHASAGVFQRLDLGVDDTVEPAAEPRAGRRVAARAQRGGRVLERGRRGRRRLLA